MQRLVLCGETRSLDWEPRAVQIAHCAPPTAAKMSGSAALRHVCEGGGERRKQQGVSESVRETSSNSQEENTSTPPPLRRRTSAPS